MTLLPGRLALRVRGHKGAKGRWAVPVPLRSQRKSVLQYPKAKAAWLLVNTNVVQINFFLNVVLIWDRPLVSLRRPPWGAGRGAAEGPAALVGVSFKRSLLP